MSHITIIISRAAPSEDSLDAVYEYSMPVPHDATPQQVGEMVRKAFRRLESADDTDH